MAWAVKLLKENFFKKLFLFHDLKSNSVLVNLVSADKLNVFKELSSYNPTGVSKLQGF